MNLYILEASGRLSPYKQTINDIILQTYTEVSAILPLKNPDIVVYDWPERAIENYGTGGYTPNQYLLEIFINPEEINKTLEKNLKRTITHELHHSARWASTGYGTTLLEALITEGLAEHFETEVTSGNPNPWDIALSESQITEISDLAAKEYFNEKYDHNKWFFGTDPTIPKWTGYTLGFDLVGKYLKKHPSSKPSTLYSTKTKSFFIE